MADLIAAVDFATMATALLAVMVVALSIPLGFKAFDLVSKVIRKAK